MISRSNVRNAVLARLVKSTSGAEAGVMRSSSVALIVCLCAFWITTVGSGVPSRDMGLLGTRFMNIAAHRIEGAGKAARLAALRAPAGHLSLANFYNAKCALCLGPVLRVSGSSIRGGIFG